MPSKPTQFSEQFPARERSLAELVFRSLNVGAAILDKEGCYVAFNDRWSELVSDGNADDLIGQDHFTVCRTFFSRKEFAAVKAGEERREQLAHLSGIGDAEKVLRWNAAPVAGDEIACVIVVRLVERSQEDVKQLLRDRDQLRFAVDGADYGLWDWDVVTSEVYFSRQYMKMLGYEHFELPHSYDTWALLCKPEDLVEYQQAIEDYVAAGDGVLEDEYQLIRKDGSLVWILSRGKIVSRLPDGSPLRIVGTHQDISVQKKREEQLVAAKEEADKANKAKSNFLALISHEVRTPLNGITSVLELLGDEPDEGERKRLSKVALNSCDQLLTVLSDVLDVSKMEAGRFDLNPKPVKIANLVEELSQTHRKANEAKGLKFSTSLNGNPDLDLMMDPVRITQILNNFLSNATKFTEKGEVALRVDIDETYGASGTGKVFVSFAIHDDGVGLTPGERGRLFQPFYQAAGTRSRSSEGTGLGLSICKSLAAMMGGKVWCASKKGLGSTFYFEVAFERATANGDAQERSDDQRAQIDASDVRVLAAEDNPVNQMMLKKFLVERFGYKVTLVSNGQQAIDALAKNDFEIVLMDIHMPVLDGVEATRKIRASSHPWKDTPIIALTADAAELHVQEYQQVGINECVAKPIDWQALDQVIKKVCLTALTGQDKADGG